MKKVFTLLTLCILTSGAWSQTQNIYEWKNNSVTIRTIESFDSLTFALPADAFVFTTGSPSALGEKSMSATFKLTTSLSISNASSTTEQGVCYSADEAEPTVACSCVSRGTFTTGSWMAELTKLRSGTQYYYRPYLRVGDAVFYGATKSFTTLGEYVETPDNAVDLGLPSGILWASCNVGAESPEEYGDYFAWGETEPKSNYSWSTYKWCNGSYDTQTKYCTSSSYGTVDNKTVLEPEDDAATANWGGNWRMPTEAELDELRTECTWTWITLNGVNGYEVTGPNGNSIFLPAAGYRHGTDVYDRGSDGYFWSATLYSGYSNYACYLNFGSGHFVWYYYYRSYGLTVRPVTE